MMVYRYENGEPIRNPRKLDVCKFAERDFLAKSDENRYYVDGTDGIHLCLWAHFDTPDETYQYISFEEIIDHPEQNTSNIWGWDEFERRFNEGAHGMRLMPMASGAVYSCKDDDELWKYEFEAIELDDVAGYPWPGPFDMDWQSEYARFHPARLRRVRLFDVEYDFFEYGFDW